MYFPYILRLKLCKFLKLTSSLRSNINKCCPILVCPRSWLADVEEAEARNRNKRGIMRRIPLLITYRVACRWAK